MNRGFFLFVLPFLGLFQCEQDSKEELVHIQDPGFLRALLELGVDSNGDGLISYPEAEATRSLKLKPSGISNLTGMEAFIHMDTLMIWTD